MELQKIFNIQKKFTKSISEGKVIELDKQKFSVIAELVEFNEELPIDMTHKYWKKNKFNEEKMLTELCDTMLFVFECMYTSGEEISDYNAELFRHFSSEDKLVKSSLYQTLYTIINDVICERFNDAISNILTVFNWLGVDNAMLSEIFLTKIITNYERLLKEEWV